MLRSSLLAICFASALFAPATASALSVTVQDHCGKQEVVRSLKSPMKITDNGAHLPTALRLIALLPLPLAPVVWEHGFAPIGKTLEFGVNLVSMLKVEGITLLPFDRVTATFEARSDPQVQCELSKQAAEPR